jgi:hypothetical protein
MLLGSETLAGDAIQDLLKRLENDDLTHGEGRYSEYDIVEEYLNRIVSDLHLQRPLNIVVDCGNGVAGAFAPMLYRRLNCKVRELFCEVDGTFPNHHPDPSQPKNLQDVIHALASTDAEIGLAFDGDGDRLGVVTKEGNIIYPDRQMMLFAADVLSRNPKAKIIFDVKCTRNLAPWIKEYKGEPIMSRTGHSFIKAKMKETGAVVLERHLQGQRHAAELVGDPLARQRQQFLAEAAGLVALLRLEVGADHEEGLDEARLRGRRRGGEAGHLLGGGEEHVGQRLVAVDVEEERAAGALHFRAHQEDLGAGDGVGRAPFAVEVAPGGVGAQVAAHRAVRVHVRHDVQHGVLAHLARDRVGIVEQALEEALDEPFRHGLAGMLARDDPHRHPSRRVAPDRHHVEVPPIHRTAEVAHAGVGRELDAREQVEVTLVRIGLEVGVVGRTSVRRGAERKRLRRTEVRPTTVNAADAGDAAVQRDQDGGGAANRGATGDQMYKFHGFR